MISNAATVTFEGTLDDTNWVAIRARNLNTGAVVTSTSESGLFLLPVNGLSQIRARVSAFTSGTVTVKSGATAGSAPEFRLTNIETVTVTIANGASLSDEADVGEGRVLVGILMPAAWTAASMTFQAGAVSGALGNLYDEYGTEVEYTVDASRYVAVDIPTFASARYVKVRSGTSGTPVNQAAERTITLVTRPL